MRKQAVAAVAVLAAVGGATVASHPGSTPAYSRDKFGAGWTVHPDGCDTREDVLRAESKVTPVTAPGCVVVSGDWVSPYDGFESTDPRAFDIDHVVPLAEAWRSGAYRWTKLRRVAYANDIAHPEHLVAVSAHTNRQKGAADPAFWVPPNRGYVCTYLSAWTRIKRRWRLAENKGERAAIRADRRAYGC